jgi:hypothetical protein
MLANHDNPPSRDRPAKPGVTSPVLPIPGRSLHIPPYQPGWGRLLRKMAKKKIHFFLASPTHYQVE